MSVLDIDLERISYFIPNRAGCQAALNSPGILPC